MPAPSAANTTLEIAERANAHLDRREYTDAVRVYTDALATLPAAGDDAQSRQRIDWTLALVQCQSYHAPAENSALLGRVLQLTKKQMDRRRTAQVLLALAGNAFILGQVNRALHYATECMDSAHPNTDRDLITLCASLSGQAYVVNARFGDAITALGRYLARTAGEVSAERAFSECFLCVAHGFRGEFDLAVEHGENGLRLAREAGSLPRELSNILALETALTLKGDWPGVARVAGQPIVLESPKFLRSPLHDGMRRSFAGYARGMQGDIAGGHAAMDQAIADIEATRSTNSLCLHYALFAEMCVRQGDLDRGQASAARALTFTANGERFAETIAYRALGLCAAARGAAHRDEALDRLRQSVALADARGGHPNAAIGRYHLARVLNDAGDRDAALDHLAAAQSCFAELGMPTWRDTAARMAL